MVSFGFFPFGFFLPLVFLVILGRVASGFFRSSQRRRNIEREYEQYLPGTYQTARPQQQEASNEAKLFKLAYKLKGKLTVSDIVVETGLGVSDAEAMIESMVDNTHVRMEVDDRGIVTYEFPEIMRRFEAE